MINNVTPRACCLVLLAVAVAILAGCASPGRVYVIPAEAQRMDMDAPLLVEYTVSRAYYWTDSDDQVLVALELAVPNTQERSNLSLVVKGLPAGQGRNYVATKRTLRALIDDNGPARRFGSLHGAVSIWYDESAPYRLRGRFRIWANQQTYWFWMDYWSSDREVLLTGEFDATRDAEKGRPILEQTEADELKRGKPGTQPRPVTGPPIGTVPNTAAKPAEPQP